MDLNDNGENIFLSQVDLSSIDFLADDLNNRSENLFLSQIDESVLKNEAFLNCDEPFDLGLNLEKFINSCADADGAEDAKLFAAGTDKDRNGKYIRFIGRYTKTFKGGLTHRSVSNKDIKHYCTEGNLFIFYLDACMSVCQSVSYLG